jgi:hypothetical protein
MKSWLNALAATSILAQLANAIVPSPTRWASGMQIITIEQPLEKAFHF